MPQGRPPGSQPSLRVRDILYLGLLLPIAAAALQKQPYHAPDNKHTEELSNVASAAEQRWRSSVADSLHTPHSGHHGFRDTDVNIDNDKARTSQVQQRALATVSPAESNSAAVAPPAHQGSSASSSAGLTSRLPARSLQDWQVEDIMLLATVDGKLHARNRKTGAPIWTLETDREMVESIRHPHNKTVGEDGKEQEDPWFVVEPTQDGAIYILAPGFGLQRLPYTVKQLADLSPYAGDGFPAVAYTAEKKNTLYTVDAATGHILKTFSAVGSIVNDDRSCRRANPMELEEPECEPIGTLTLGRTEYTIGIQDRNTGQPINTLKYFEWGPNNRDHDLRSKYQATMDKRYVYPKFDGNILGVDLNEGNKFTPVPKPSYRRKFSSPVARVFDVVRPTSDLSSDASLVILPQPAGPSPEDSANVEDKLENVYVDCTPSGNWYALSESKYPSVTENAPLPKYLELGRSISLPVTKKLFAGVHSLAVSGQGSSSQAIESSNLLTIDPGPPVDSDLEPLTAKHGRETFITTAQALVLMILAGVFGCGYVYKQFGVLPWKPQLLAVPDILLPNGQQPFEKPESSHTMVREAEPAQETIFPHDPAVSPTPQVRFDVLKDEIDVENDNEAGADDEDPKDNTTPKKGKATRGKRAGKKNREKSQLKEQVRAEVQALKNGVIVPQASEVITVAASESAQVSGPLQINSLIIHTDKIIGQGSCGTIVFEGAFEGRDVAVKRMLSQYYELASQEVSFLQQSDDHANVVRYFCQQKDDHFLYIAVELCQASLFEVWEAEKAKTEVRQLQLRALKTMMQQDMTRTLQQLAAGLCHLHHLRIIHRDIKPQNILVAYPKRTQAAGTTRLVISDFGLGKNLPENVSTLIDPTGNAGTSGWKAPELISQPREISSNNTHSTSHNSDSGVSGVSGVKRAADIFSLGCLFFWVLTDGVHPYEDGETGWQQLRELNIKRDRKNMDALERWSDAYEPMQLITSMLEHQPEQRPTAQAVLNHPYFWAPEKRLAFLCDVSDHFEREPRGTYEDYYADDSPHLRLLEKRVVEIVGAPVRDADFLAKLDRHFVDTLGKQRKYSGYRVLDLLRALRNKKNHYEDMPESVKRNVGPLPGGYLSYWCNRFPRLLMACYEVVLEAKLQNTDRFKGYFGLGSV